MKFSNCAINVLEGVKTVRKCNKSSLAPTSFVLWKVLDTFFSMIDSSMIAVGIKKLEVHREKLDCTREAATEMDLHESFELNYYS